MTLKESMSEYEKRLLLAALEDAGWNQRRAAAALGLLPTTLSEKLKRFGLRRARSFAAAPQDGETRPSAA